MREKEGDEAAIEEFFRRRRGERCENTEYESDVLGNKTAWGWLDLTKLYWSRCGSYPRHTKLELCMLYVLSQSSFRIAPLSLSHAVVFFDHSFQRVYDGASTKRGASGVHLLAEVYKEGTEAAAAAVDDAPRESAMEESRPSGSKDVVDDDRL